MVTTDDHDVAMSVGETSGDLIKEYDSVEKGWGQVANNEQAGVKVSDLLLWKVFDFVRKVI